MDVDDDGEGGAGELWGSQSRWCVRVSPLSAAKSPLLLPMLVIPLVLAVSASDERVVRGFSSLLPCLPPAFLVPATFACLLPIRLARPSPVFARAASV